MPCMPELITRKQNPVLGELPPPDTSVQGGLSLTTGVNPFSQQLKR